MQALRITPEDAQNRTFWKSRIAAADPTYGEKAKKKRRFGTMEKGNKKQSEVSAVGRENSLREGRNSNQTSTLEIKARFTPIHREIKYKP